MNAENAELFSFESAGIEEVTAPDSPYMSGMERWLELTFPEYCPPRFAGLLSSLRRPGAWQQIQIFVCPVEGQVTGLAQKLYLEWQGNLLADIDLLGVLAPYRRAGLGLALVQRCLLATQEAARQYRVSAIGVVTLIDQTYAPIIRLHQKLGGQIRADYQYPSGDWIVWYPLQREYEEIPTSSLGEQVRRFGGLLECE
jgi:GNAT superfamily N-acetyltransferase